MTCWKYAIIKRKYKYTLWCRGDISIRTMLASPRITSMKPMENSLISKIIVVVLMFVAFRLHYSFYSLSDSLCYDRWAAYTLERTIDFLKLEFGFKPMSLRVILTMHLRVDLFICEPSSMFGRLSLGIARPTQDDNIVDSALIRSNLPK